MKLNQLLKMEKLKNNQFITGITSRSIVLLSLLITSFMTSSCSVIEGIFKAGMGVGIFIVVAIIIIIIIIFSRVGNKKDE